jgi:thiol-disulfide isomerase/thioredoxin
MSEARETDKPTTRVPWGTWLALAVVSLAVLAPLIYQGLFPSLPEAQTHPGVGKEFNTIDLEPLTGVGGPVSAADLKDKVVLINFWGTWCPPCLMELPHIAELADELQAREDFKLLAVSCGQGMREDMTSLRRDTEELFNQEGIVMPTYADPDWKTRDAAIEVTEGRFSYPTTLVLDRSGVVRAVWIGYRPGYTEQMRDLVTRLLKEAPPDRG